MSRFIDAVVSAARGSDTGIRVLDSSGAVTALSWSQVREHAHEMVVGLAGRGIRPGDRIAALVADPREVGPLVQGAWLRGAAVTLLQQPTQRVDLQSWVHTTVGLLKAIDPSMCVIGTEFAGLAAAFAEAGVAVVTVDALAVGGVPVTDTDSAEDDVALLQLSSGSTGTPKVVAITHKGMYENWAALAGNCSFDANSDRMVSWLPLFHDLGMIGFMAGPMQSGMDVVSVRPEHFLASPSIWPELITEYGGTVTGGPNFAYAVLARTLESAVSSAFDLSSLRVVVNGGEPVDARTLRHLTEAGYRFGLKPESLVMGYGMAEATLGIAGTRPGEQYRTENIDFDRLENERYAAVAPPLGEYRRREMVVIGRAMPGMGIRVVDDHGARQHPRAVGEIQIRGAAVTRRYRTTEGWQDACDGSGWLKTGDLGYLTEAGEVVICGRKKDTIIIAGRNIFPTHIEWAAGQVDGVRAGNTAAVRVVNDGRESFAVLVESRMHGDDDHVVRICAAVTQRVVDEVGISPREVIVLAPGQLPKTSSGKIRRSVAATLCAAGAQDQDD